MKQERRKFLKQLGVFSAGVSLFPVSAAGNYAAEAGANSCAPCTLDYYGEGPFYTKNPPEIKNGQLADSNEAGERLIISGRVTNNDCTEYIENAVIDVWHADDSGAYDNTGYKLRGKTKSDNQGYYSFETIKPGKYLNGNEYRPSHIHFKITAPGKSTLTTQLYFEGDTSIKNDAAASIESGTYDATDRIIPLSKENGISTFLVVPAEGLNWKSSDIKNLLRPFGILLGRGFGRRRKYVFDHRRSRLSDTLLVPNG